MATASVTLGIDTVPFEAGLRRAEARSQSFSHKVSQLFRRTPERRAEQAISGFVADISTGNVAGAITGITARMTGFGLAMGVAVGAGIELFTKFRAEIDATTSAEIKLGNELATLGGIRGPEQAAAKLALVTAQVDDLIQKSSSAGSKFGNFLDKFVNPLLGTSSKNTGAAQASEIQAGLKGEAKLMGDRATAEERVVALREEALTGSERQAALDKIELETAQKLSAIEEVKTKYKLSLFDPKVSGKLDPLERNKLILASEATAKREKASTIANAQLSKDLENQKFDIKERQLSMEAHLVSLAQEGVSVADQKHAALKDELQIIQEQLANSKQLTEEDKTQLQVAEARAKVRLRDAQFAQFQKTPQERIQDERTQQGHMIDLNRFNANQGLLNVHRDMNGNVIGGTDPSTGKHVNLDEGGGTLDQTFTRSRDAYNALGEVHTQGRDYRTPTFGSSLGELDKQMMSPGHMNILGPMNRFGQPGGEGGMAGPKAGGEGGGVIEAINKGTAKMQELWGG